MTPQQAQLIRDNPNLSSAALARFTGLTYGRVHKARGNQSWSHKGYGIPFMCFVNRKDQACYQVSVKGRLVFNGLLAEAIEYVDRVIYCLENNDGKLPPPLSEWSLSNITFINKEGNNNV